ncbi:MULTISPECIES: DUF6691 family protein [unclassified Nitrosomonas]|jgi:uncharacterized membrane protein YedE/YeeE|uniref:DUF6691 family protein n=1 Tax=unclassified Nitrosomonas TaxID=2609265 RepID=UPI001D923B44|nr:MULTISPECIES: DUF6691 family protein [unclassified Nitrosomonas]MBX9893982.1 YeeE/YedE family protein [Nitrosomonas sp.]WMJ09024.1 YeeE/YedE thiosulfate transporter family protein [Nitrosomonas sp. sh817]
MMMITALLAGLVFGMGLILSGMVNPAIVLAFLDVAGDWDASLLWVMGGAVTAGSVAFALAKRQKTSFLGVPMQLPAAAKIDKRLLLGSFLFGIGWGIAGICPGPALVLAGSGKTEIFVFLIPMLLGMGIFEIVEKKHR